MRNFIRYILILLLATVYVTAYSNPISFRSLTTSEGLSDLLVNAIYKDNAGFVWLGTGSTLERFDGVHLKHYTIPGNNEKLKRVQVLAQTDDSRLWMGNGMGLWRMDQLQQGLERMVPETIDCPVYALLPLKDILYIGTEKGLYIYKGGTLSLVLLDSNLFSSGNAVTGLCEGIAGDIWLTTKNGLCSLRKADNKITSYRIDEAAGSTEGFTRIVRIGQMLYLGTSDKGLITFDLRTHRFEPYLHVGCNVISSLSTDSKRMLYVGTDGNGVHFIDVTQNRIERSIRYQAGVAGGIRSNSVYSLLVDPDGIIWVGFYQSGLDYTLYQSNLFQVYSYPPFLQTRDMPVRALAVRGDEKVIGSRDGLYYIDESRSLFRSFNVPQMRSGMVFSILFYEGEYYIGTYGGGMYVLNPHTMLLRDFQPKGDEVFRRGNIFILRQDRQKRLWIGTSEGVYCYRDGKIEAHYTSANSKLPDGNVYEIYFDITGKGWFCTENGMCIWDSSSSKFRTDVFPDGFIQKEKIRVVYEDKEHQLYFFPDKGALFVSDLGMSRFQRLQPHTPIEGKDGQFIIEDPEGWLWLGTGDGLFRYDKKSRFMPYTFAQGIPSSIFTLCPPAIDEHGNLWMGNTKGLLSVSLKEVGKASTSPYPVRVTDVFVDGKSGITPLSMQSDGGIKLTFKSSQKNITFCFSDFSYTSPIYMAYEYQLEGEDEDWIPLTGRSDVNYFNLASGNYQFRVRRMGQPDSEVSISIHIATPFMGWVGAGVTILLIAALGWYRWNYRKEKKEKNEEQAVPVVQKPVEAPVADTAPVEKVSTNEEKYKTVRLSEEECKLLAKKLDELMRIERPFTNSNLKIADLASKLSTSPHTLSYLFNQHLKHNYYDYLNDFRIAEFKRLVAKDEYARYTLGALAELCGFSSRASFFRYFKKSVGITPNEYIRSIGKGV